MDIPFRIPGTTEPEIIIRRSWLGNVAVVVGGTALKRRGRGLTYDIPLPDGTVTELQLNGQWTGLRATVNGVKTALEPPIPRLLVLVTFLPLLLVVIGGAIGGAIGVVTAGTNLTISRSRMRIPLKLVAMLGATALGVAIYVGVAVALAPIPALAAGQCVNGIHEGAELSASSYRPVDCAGAHDNEVIGIVQATATGPYPGQQALFDFATNPCYAAFATYVGIDFQTSELSMIVVTPSDVTWVKGDRVIACVAVAPNPGKLTGSVKGTAR